MVKSNIESQPTVFIIDDDDAVRKSLAMVLEMEGMRVAAYASAEAFLASALPHGSGSGSGCAIVDMYMPGMTGLELQQHLIDNDIALPIVFLTGHGEIPDSVAAIKHGAEDFLVKPITVEKLLPVIQASLAKSELLQAKIKRQQDVKSRTLKLTQREWEVLRLTTAGFSAKEIARDLNISFRTVEKHKSSLLLKTGAKNMLDLLSDVLTSGALLDDGFGLCLKAE
ncbi:response regulator transcription factor [Methylomonas koyamae]|uniref:response regulator transcription factor n=1 Tax=Methylomonas koyamae TaxID=702114 RepID=UPI0007C8BA0F|nr:response regulator [Methylomonas koyamae]